MKSDTNPFDAGYVFEITLKHMERSVNISMQKTVDRMGEFKDDPEKTREVLSALTNLSKLNNLIQSIRDENKDIIGDRK